MQAVVVGIVAVVVGIAIGFFAWGSPARQLESEVAAARTQAQQASVQEGTVATKIQALEAQVKQALEGFKSEQDQRQKLEALVAKLKKKK
jgi:peptidoglycan hydrolase CwlO-like protein